MKRELSIFSFALALVLLTDTSLRSASVTWTNSSGGSWDVAANWDANQVPGPNDTAIITNLGVTVYLSSGTTVGGITLGGFYLGNTTLAMNGQTLALNGAMRVYPSGSFTVDSGTLVGNTNAVLSGTLGWSAAYLGGTLTLASGAVLTITSGNDHNMPNCIFTNYGTVAWSSGRIRGGANPTGTQIYNFGLWDCQADLSFNDDYSGAGTTFNNYGVLRKSGGASEFSSATVFTGGVFLNQLAGVIDVQNGTNGLALELQGGATLNGGYITTNQFGRTVLSSGNFNINGTVTGTNTWQDGGNLSGPTIISGALTWMRGSWNSAPSVTLGLGCTLLIPGSSDHDMANCAFTNNGTVAWSNGRIRGGANPTGTQIYNFGLWDCQADLSFNDDFSGAGTTFNNYGVLRKSGGASEFSSATVFTGGVFLNQLGGVIDVQNGTNGLALDFQGGANLNGGYISTNRFGLTKLSSGNFNINGTVTGTNTWQDGGNLSGPTIISGALTWMRGYWNSAPSVTLGPGCTLLIPGSSDHDMANCAFTNYGTVAWSNGRIRGGANPTGTQIYNFGLWDCQADLSFNDDYSGAGTTFNNYGVLRKSGGAGVFGNAYTLMAVGVLVNQISGVIDVQNGTNGLELVFSGGGNFTGGYITTNANGVTYLANGNFNLNGTVTPTNLIENAGNLVGDNVVKGALTWQNGQWYGANSVSISANSTVLVAGGVNNMIIYNLPVTNYGTVNWISGYLDGGGGSGTQVYNYGLWDCQSDFNFKDDAGNQNTVFYNYSTFRKSRGANTSQTLLQGGVYFDQISGVMDVQQGNLVLQGSASLNGGYITTNASAYTYLNSGGFNLNGTVTPPNVIENGGNLVGTNVIRGSLTWVNGQWSGANSLTIASNSFVNLAGGGNNLILYNLPVTNFGTVNWVSGYPDGGGNPGTQIYNYGMWDCQSDYNFKCDAGNLGTVFYNYSNFRKSAGTNTSQTLIQGGVYFDQVSGIMDVKQGNLVLQGGASLNGGYITTNASAYTYLNSGGFNLNGTVTPPNVIENGGNLVGTNVIHGSLTWVNGQWSGASSVTVASNSTVNLAGGQNNLILYNLPVTNFGTVDWSSGYPDGGGNPGTQVYNYGLWDCQGDYNFKVDAGNLGAVFYNYGTLRKSVGSSSSQTLLQGGLTLINSGTVAALVGNLNFNNAPALSGGTLDFGIGGTNTFGTVNISGTASLAGGVGAVLLNGFLPTVGASFQVMSYGSTNGAFTDYTGLNAGSGVAFTPILSATSLTLSTVATNFVAVAPIIISQPASQSANYGSAVTLGVGVSGSPILLYQWNQNTIPIPGATNATLNLSNLSFAQSAAYTVGITNSAGGVLSQVAQLTVVPVLPSFTAQPQSITVPIGSNAVFNVTVAGEPPPVVQWQFNGSNLVDGGRISGSGTTTLSITNLKFSDTGNYSAIASNAYGVAISSTATLQAGFPNLAPYGITTPSNATLGQTIQLVYSITNSASGEAEGPWLNKFLLALDTNGTSAYIMGTATFNGSILPFSSVTVTQSVIMPATIFGPRYLGVVVDSAANLPEVTWTNKTAYASTPIQINGADLALAQPTSPGTAQYGQVFTVSFAVTNIGTAPAISGWSDQIYISSSPTSLAGATLLATLPGTFPLPPGTGYASSHSVSIPQTSASMSGTFYLIVDADAGISQLETNYANNVLSTPIVLSLPPLPDLVVGQVVSPTNALAGQSIPVTWAVTNTGAATATGPWQETVYLVPASLSLSQLSSNWGAYPALGVFTFTNNLLAGSSLTRTQAVMIPWTGLAGDLRTAVLVNSGNSVLESNPTNDAALALNDLQVPVVLSLTLPVTSVNKNTSTPNLSCLVSRNGSVGAATVVSLTSSATNLFLVPGTVTIPAGAASAPFSATVIDDGVPGPDILVSIGASAGGYLGSTTEVTVVNTDVPILTLSLSNYQPTEGQILTATVSSTTISSNPVTVAISTSSSTALATPTSVTIPAYSNSVNFTVLAVQGTIIAPAQNYTINASAAGYQGSVVNLLVLNNNAPTLTLSLNNTNIEETAGPFAAMGTVSRFPITDQAVSIALGSTNPGAATVPARVVIPAFQNGISFYVAPVNDTNITGTKTTLISAQALDNTGSAAGSAVTQLLFVQDESGPNLKVAIAGKVVGKGLSPATSAVVSLAVAPTNNVVVSLTSSATNQATVPATVVIQAGQTSATFNITSLNDGVVSNLQPVTITASAAGYAQGSDVLSITDIGLPDLVVSSITMPAAVSDPAPLTLSFRLFNQGLGALTNGVNQNVYLTTDPASGNYIPMGTTFFGGPLAPGHYVDESLIVPGSSLPAPGTYWVVVVADAFNTAAELNYANNTSISQTALVISPAYSATVKAGTNNVLPGTPVPLSGSATLTVGGAATNSPVNILITLRGLQRILSATTDANGNFSAVFNPLPNEAGNYTIAAVFPGITSAPAQDQFNILGMLAAPASLNLTITQSSNQVNSISFQNLGEVPLTGLAARLIGLPANLSASASFSTNYLDGQSAVSLSLQLTAADASIRQSAFTVQVTSSEGAVLNLPVNVTVNALTANLVVYPSSLSASMLRGGQAVVSFNVVNSGGAPTGPLGINLPSVGWLSVVSTNPIPSIAAGATNQVTLLLSPDANMALGPYSGSLSVVGSGVGLLVPFTFTAVSDAHGALTVQSVDEYTYFAAGAPPLTNATVSLINPYTQAVVASGVTDSNGLFSVSGVMEGVYELDLSANQHSPFRGEAIVTAGQTNNVLAFLSRQTVTYTWTVVPISIQDTTHITIQATFEANVPAPVVVPNPSSIDLGTLTQPGQFLDIPFTVENYGLIGVQNLNINISQSPLYRFDLATTTIGDLPAHGTYTIPMRITRLSGSQSPALAASSASTPGSGAPCNINFGLNYSYPCGPFGVYESVQVTVLNVTGDCTPRPVSYTVGVTCNNCGSGGGGPGGGGSGSGGFFGGGTVSVPPSISLPPSCDPCWDAARDCIIGFIPVVGCIYSAYQGCLNKDSRSVENCTFAAVGCIGGDLGNIAACLQSVLRCICPESANCWSNFVYQAYANGSSSPVASAPAVNGFSNNDLRDVYWARSYAGVALMAMTIGDTDGRWFSPGSSGAFSTWYNGFTAAIQPGSLGGVFISPAEATNLLALPTPNTVSNADVVATINRWNLTISNWDAGILSPTNPLAGSATNFMDFYAYTNLFGAVIEQYLISQAAGYASPVAGLISAMQASGKQAGSVCARVVLQIDQDAVLTRDAFHATLQLDNSSADLMSNVSVHLVVQNTAGQDVTSLLGIEAPVLSGSLTAVDGTGSLPANNSGSAQWTIIPSIDAAPHAPTNYLVSGTFSYVQNGATITIPLSPAPITVQPSPILYLKYFLQRDVFGDDPFTPAIEPSIPYPLAVMVENKGYGHARNFQITSAQPTIVDNDKGLLINFKIIGTEVAGQPVTPSLTANFGDVAPQSIKIGEWFLISSLQGLFINYSATFQHIDPLGNPRLSLIQGVDIHEMIHMVQAPGVWDDGQPDFITVETPNYLSLPDTLYLSDGTVHPVSVVQTGATDAPASTNHLQVQFTANFPAGFTYVVVPDPANGLLPLVAVQDSNGTNLLTPNFYTTDRTFIGLGQRPLDENNLHLFDYHTNAGSYTYTLVYQAPPAVAYTNPPVSSVFSLPPTSPTSFGLAWSGAPYVGQAPVAYYDIYVSDNGGPYNVWQSQTTATGAFFTGTNGNTYSFYSIATDTAGNREATPLQPQATTSVNSTNYPPTISLPAYATVNAGNTLTLNVTAGDPNPFANLTFRLGAGAPSGMTINPSTGQITWPTSPAYGGTTNLVRVIVSDNNQPPLTATGVVSVAVIQILSPPVLAPIANYTLYDGSLLTVTNTALDTNLPPRTLTFSLGAGAPNNAVIDPISGFFQWRPSPAQAPSTNTITVIVTDNGVPPLSASQQFTVVVKSATFEFLLGVGSTNVVVGNAASVPVTLQSSLPLTNITAILQVPPSGLTNWSLLAASPEITSTLLQSIGSNQYSINLTLNPALSPGETRTLAQLGFVSGPQAHSAVVPLNLPSLSGVESDGTTAPKPGTAGGNILVIAREPLLQAWVGSNSARKITLYGRPGASYQLEYATNLLSPNWQLGMIWPMTNNTTVLTANPALSRVYYRAMEFSANPPILQLNSASRTNLVLLLYGQSGTNYSIVAGTNLANYASWQPLYGFTLTNSFQFINTAVATNQIQLFRVLKP